MVVLVVTDEEKMKPIPLVIALPKKPIRIILVASLADNKRYYLLVWNIRLQRLTKLWQRNL